MKTTHTSYTRFDLIFWPIIFTLICLLTTGSRGAELLRNRSFSDNTLYWKTSEATGSWNPYVYDATTGGHVNLHPPGSYIGGLIRQSLNVTGIANQQVQVSLKLRKTSAVAGNTISVRLQYVSTGNQVHEVEVVNPSNDSVSDWTTVNGNFTFPADARKLTALLVYKADYGDFDADDFSVTGSALNPGTIPAVEGYSPMSGNYGTLVTFTGNGFGASQGQLLLRGSSQGVAVQSWTATQVTATVQEPARNGRWALLADYVEADGDLSFDVTSPNFTVDVLGSPYRVAKGATAYVPLQVNLLNGFTTAGGIGFFLPDAPEAATFSPANTKVSGGVLMKLNTSGLTAGKHTYNIQTFEGSSYARFVPLEIEVVNVTDIKFMLLGSELPAGPLAINTQGEINGLGFTLYDSAGKSVDASAATVDSSNPTLLFAQKDNFNYWRFFALDNGSVTLTVTAPNGYSETLTVNVSVPSSPKVTGAAFAYPTISNKGDVTNTFYASSTDPLGVGWQNITLVNQNTEWGAGSTQVTTTFKVTEGELPGTYLFYAYNYSGTYESGYTETSKRYVPLTVVNDSSRGMITGRIVEQGSSGMAHLNGTLELYDASSQALVKQRFIYLFGEPNYVFPYVAPGNYKLRFVPGDNRKAPQWYPNAASFATAGTITVSAGNTVPDINFFNTGISLREAIDFDTADIFTSGFNIISTDTGWYGQRTFTHDNSDAEQTPMLMDNGNAFIEGTIVGPGTLSFWWKVSSETNADYLTFTLNWNNFTKQSISGEVDWTLVTVTLPEGPNTVLWEYNKNGANSAGMDAAWVDQFTFTPSGGPTAPSIQTQPQSQTVNPGANVQFTVVATGTAPLSYLWKKNGSEITGATTDTLTLNNVSALDAATYTVLVSNGTGSAPSEGAILTVRQVPNISVQPQSHAVNAGANVQFTVTATGTTPLYYQWKKNGNDINGANTDTLTLNNVSALDVATYSVVVSNAAGSAPSDGAALTLNTLPTVSVAPISQSVSPGSAVTFSVTATGTGPFTYQWKQNNVVIDGATSYTYSIPASSGAHVGTYTVVITGPAGSVESTAQLTMVDLHMYAGILINGTVGNQYQIDFTTSLNEPVTWQLLRTVTLSTSSQIVVDENSPGQPRRFYRTVLVVP